ncbi:recombinase family protein [Sphaerisporangium viridialbum]|uniref:recombinase family protein n=1 Tax=Sphaerisporangium viridialbum TaxID=46189 RepID=UPI003C71ECB5
MTSSQTPAAPRITVDYCRISYDKRGTAEGVDTQHYENVNAAEELGETIAETFTDNDLSAFSGAERPDYQRMLQSMRSGRIGLIIIRHADRLHRDVEEVSRFIEIARAHTVKLYSGMRGSFYNLNKAAGRKDLINDTLNAQYESDHRGERVTDARKRQARNGDYGGGPRCYGWGVDTGRVTRYCVNPKAPTADRIYAERSVLDMGQHRPDEAEEIRKWADDLLADVSMAQLLADLRARKVLTVSEKDGRILTRGGKQVTHQGWNSRTVLQILLSPRVSGHSVHKGQIIKRNAYPYIIPEDQRQALITKFSDKSRKTAPGNVPRWLVSLIAECAVCDDGTTMSVRNNSKGEPVYRCREKGHNMHLAHQLDDYVTELMIGRLSRNDVASLLPSQVTVDAAALRDELITLETRKTNAARKFASGAWDEEMVDEILVEVNARAAEIREELRSASAVSPIAEFVATDDAEATWEDLSLGRQREIVKLLVKIRLHPIGRGRRLTQAEQLDLVEIIPQHPNAA